MVTLSVLMSVYHRETGQNLDLALDSIWTKQTRKPDQIVLVQDGLLTEELYVVIEKYKKICGSVLCSPALKMNSGLVVALNTGLEYVTCDLVARMDSDDISSPDRFEKQVKFMEENPEFEVVAVNDLTDAEQLAYLLKYDTNHRNYRIDEISFDNDNIVIGNRKVKVYAEKDPAMLPWKDLDVDVVFECTGLFTSEEKAMAHINAGAKKVIISAPAKGDIKTIVYNVNHETLTGDEKIISAASCTTNCLAPVVDTLDKEFGAAGTYVITPEVAENSNYTVTVETGTYTVTPKSVTVKADDKSSVYGEDLAILTYTVEGLVGEDELEISLQNEPHRRIYQKKSRYQHQRIKPDFRIQKSIPFLTHFQTGNRQLPKFAHSKISAKK